MEFLLQPNVYSTGVSSNLLNMLDHMWLRDHVSGNGCLYIISGFSNYNGGVRFYPDRTVHLHFFITQVIGGQLQRKEHNAFAWITPDEIPQYEFCPADAEMLRQNATRF